MWLQSAIAARASVAPHARCSAVTGPETAMEAPRFGGREASESGCESACGWDWDWDWDCDRVPYRRRLGGIWAAWVGVCSLSTIQFPYSPQHE